VVAGRPRSEVGLREIRITWDVSSPLVRSGRFRAIYGVSGKVGRRWFGLGGKFPEVPLFGNNQSLCLLGNQPLHVFEFGPILPSH
jgi:hypothetical protein